MKPTLIVFLCIIAGAGIILGAYAAFRLFDRDDFEEKSTSVSDDQRLYMEHVRRRYRAALAEYAFSLSAHQ